ncbi:MAG TPA: thioredoxin [Methanoregulaceae archaeon]|nr:thioredoxin [Methanoregulaceae archaeon]
MEDDELARIRERKLREMEAKMKENAEGKVLHLEQANFSAITAENPALVIDFWAEWCGPCRMVGPVVEELSREFAGRVTFAKCNTDDNAMLANQFGISAIPTLLLFRDGRLADRVIGAYPKDALRTKIIQVFGSSIEKSG